MSGNSLIFEKFKVFDQLNEEIKRNIKVLYVFRDFYEEINVILITNEDQVFCLGDNCRGVLGFGHENSIQKFTINEELSQKRIIDFKSGLCHTIARTSDGKLYCWGINRYLGNGKEDYTISKPELNEYLNDENIVDMCCGFSHTLVLTSNKEVYAWGDNGCGQIGNRSNSDVVSIPLKLSKLDHFNGEKIKAISCGSEFSMALTESGCVYSWGNNSCAQLGLNKGYKAQNKPKRIRIEVEINKISCGPEHSLLLSQERDIYVFGSNQYKQLGVESDGEKQLTPIKLNHSEKFIEIASHFYYDISAALSENGLYYVWGKCGREGTISVPKETQFKSFNEIFAVTETYRIHKTGKYVNNWTEMEKIGAGSYGTVFKAKHKLNEKIFAIKKISIVKQSSLIKDSFKEFVNSFHISKHENQFLVKYHDVWIEQDFQLNIRKFDRNSTIYIQMDYCDKTLSDINEEIKKDSTLYSNNSLTHLGYYVLSELFIEILEGLKYLHDNNIIHRDLNPDNILVKLGTNGNCIKIADFGFAKVHDNNKLNTEDRYAAPEVLNSRNYDIRADIHSLGVILQELFQIDVNRNYMKNGNKKSIIMSKYEYLRVLSIKMKNEVYRRRPNCELIFKERKKWTISEREFNLEGELFTLLGISDENRSYVQNIIVSKLSIMIEKPINTCLIL